MARAHGVATTHEGIEGLAKLKHLMRKAQPREVEATWRKAGQLLDLFAPQECANYFVNAGYGSV